MTGGFSPRKPDRATLRPREHVRYSFQGLLCEWSRPNLLGISLGRELPHIIEGALFAGHLTSHRLVIEPHSTGRFALNIQKFGPQVLELLLRNVPGGQLVNLLSITAEGARKMAELAETIGFLAVDRDAIKCFQQYNGIFWPLLEYKPERGPTFAAYYFEGGGGLFSRETEEFAAILKHEGFTVTEY